MLQFRGGPALSSFRIRKLLENLRQIDPALSGLDSQLLYFADVDGVLGSTDRALLEKLLLDGAPAATPSGGLILVVPRIGTVSPWASKATDIAHVCGLKKVRRIERGSAFYLRSRAGA